MKKIIIIILIVFIFSGIIQAETNSGYLAKDKLWGTKYYEFLSSQDPVIVIIGGTHGNELGGWKAAEKLIENYHIDKGKLIIIPRANNLAVKQRLRKIEGHGDLNRAYPGNKDGIFTEKLADTIFNFIKDMNPDLVLDLHESRDFYFKNKNALGQTVIIYPDEEIIYKAYKMVENINKDINNDQEKFSVLQGPIRGSTVWATGKSLNIPAITVETCSKLNLDLRIDYQIKIVKYILNEFGMKLKKL